MESLRRLVEVFFQGFGIVRMPWVAQVYLLLTIILVIVLMTAALINPPPNATREVIENLPITKLFNTTSDLLKTVIGALLGSLTMAAQKSWKKEEDNQ